MRGDVHRLKDDPRARGHEQRGFRLCVIIQSDAVITSTVIVCPTSTSTSANMLHPSITIGETETRVLVEHVRAVNWVRIGQQVGRVTHSEMQDIVESLKLVQGIF